MEHSLRPEEILYVAFNQDSSCFTVGTENGFWIYKTHPLQLSYHRDFAGGIGIVQLLYRTNIIGITGGGKLPRYPPNKVIIWDDHQMRPSGELSLRYEIKGLRLRRDLLLVIAQTRVYIYNLHDLKLRDILRTCNNPTGLCDLSTDPHPVVVACPDRQRGTVLVKFDHLENSRAIITHDSALACLALNKDGTLLATASDKGTVIRVFQVNSGEKLQEVRRGMDRAEIYSMSFHPESVWLACTSDKGTIHVFSIGSNVVSNPASKWKFLKKLLPKYFDSEWSFAQYRLNAARTLCSFTSSGEYIAIVSPDGDYYLLMFDASTGGDCVLLQHSNLTDFTS